jgi:signal transduction histidine kinase
MKLVRRSLFLRLLSIELAVLTVLWTGVTYYALGEARAGARGGLDRDLVLFAESLARLSSVAADPVQSRSIGEALRALDAERNPLTPGKPSFVYRIWRTDGSLLARSADEFPVTTLPGLRAASGRVDASWLARSATSADGRIVSLAAFPASYQMALQRYILWTTFYLYAGLALTLAGALWIALRIGLRPLNALARSVGARSETDLSPLGYRPSTKDLAILAGAIDAVMARIRLLRDQERRFFANAARELSTPVTTIAAQAHVVSTEPDEAARRAAARTLDESVARAACAVRDLLRLAQLDASPELRKDQRFDLAALLREQGLDRHLSAPSSGRRLSISAPDHLWVTGDEDWLTVATSCLVEYALRRTPCEAALQLACGNHGHDAWIQARDDGPRIDALGWSGVRERAESQTSSDPSDLQIELARRIAELHGGRLALEPHGAQGLTATLVWPIAPPASNVVSEYSGTR